MIVNSNKEWLGWFEKEIQRLISANLEFPGGELLTSNSSGELDVSDHDSDSSGVDGAHVGVLEQTN